MEAQKYSSSPVRFEEIAEDAALSIAHQFLEAAHLDFSRLALFVKRLFEFETDGDIEEVDGAVSRLHVEDASPVDVVDVGPAQDALGENHLAESGGRLRQGSWGSAGRMVAAPA